MSKKHVDAIKPNNQVKQPKAPALPTPTTKPEEQVQQPTPKP